VLRFILLICDLLLFLKCFILLNRRITPELHHVMRQNGRTEIDAMDFEPSEGMFE